MHDIRNPRLQSGSIKRCPRCGQRKRRRAFYAVPIHSDGMSAYCRECSLAYSHEYVRANKEKRAVYNRRYRSKNKGKLRAYYRKWYRRCGRKRARDYSEKIRAWQLAHPEAIFATQVVRAAVLTGKLKKPDRCSRCGWVGRVVGHHSDYTKPLKVTWLCASCQKLANESKKST